MRWMLSAASLVIILSVALPASAEPRQLAVPADKSWQHAETRMILPPSAAGLSRTEVTDLTAEELDVYATYQNEQSGTVATVYLYRTLLPDTPLWFDRAMLILAQQPDLRVAQLLTEPIAFARPGASAASGLRAVLSVSGASTKSTAVAIAPLEDWLLKIRLSSATVDAQDLDKQLTSFIEALGWPAAGKTERVAALVQPCATELRTKKARLVRPDMGQTLINAVLSGAVVEAEGPPPVYCRDPKPAPSPMWAVYRPDGARDRYVVAMADAGAALMISPQVSIDLLSSAPAGGTYAMTFVHHATSSVLPSFNRLPPPEQAVALLMEGRGSVVSVTGR